jgi:hypothetical protein
MAEQIIYLDPEDDHVSVRDRLDRVEADRVLLVLPASREPIRNRLDLVLVKRQAGRLGLAVAIVTTNPAIVAEARDLGLPVFPTVEIGQNRRWRWPWQPMQKSSSIEPPKPPDPGDLREMHRRSRPRAAWQQWLARLGGLALFAFSLAFLGIAAVYIIPGATVTLHPDTRDLTVTAMVIGDPSIKVSDFAAGLIPARVIRVEVSWRGSAATTGTTDVPDAPATGTVVFINQQATPVTVPSGTVVRTSSGTTIRFRTTRTVEVPGVRGATAEAPVLALDAGPWGNVDANLINQIEGALAFQLNVRNLTPTQGGGIRQTKSVTQADLDRLRGQVLQQLFQLSKAEIANWMTESEFLAEESLSLFSVLQEDYDRYVGEQADAVEMEMTALIQGYVVDTTEGYGVVYTTLANETPPGYRLLPETITPPRRGEVLKVDEQGRITFLMQGRARVAAEVDLDAVTDTIRGQPIEEASAWILAHVAVQHEPEIDVWPPWLGRLPYLPIRIDARLRTTG